MRGRGLLLLCAAAVAAMILWPEALHEAASGAVDLFLRVVIPGLLPFLMVSRYLLPRLSLPQGGILAKVFSLSSGCPASVVPAWLIARISGSPAGAAACAELYQRGVLGEKALQRAALYCSGVSPAFLTVTLSSLLGADVGWILLFSHWIGLFAACQLLRLFFPLDGNETVLSGGAEQPFTQNPPTVAQCAASSLYILGQVGCMIVIYESLWALLAASGAGNWLIQVFSRLPGEVGSLSAAWVKGLLEMTGGCAHAASAQGVSLGARCAGIAWITGFGGFCLVSQCLAVWDQCPVRKGRFLLGKILHGLASTGVCLALLRLFPRTVTAWAPLEALSPPMIGVYGILSAVLTGMVLLLWESRQRPCI